MKWTECVFDPLRDRTFCVEHSIEVRISLDCIILGAMYKLYNVIQAMENFVQDGCAQHSCSLLIQSPAKPTLSVLSLDGLATVVIGACDCLYISCGLVFGQRSYLDRDSSL